MILRQFLHADPVAISYLFGCGGKACCAVVGDVEVYLEAARATAGLRRFDACRYPSAAAAEPRAHKPVGR
jgi:hypothetical protein